MFTLDLVFAVVLLVSTAVGLWRGLVFEAMSLVSWVLAFIVARWFAADMAQWLPMGQSSATLRYAAGFAVVFVLALFAGGVVAFVLGKVVATVGLGAIDRVLGAAFGLLRGGAVLLVVTLVAQLTSLHQAQFWQESQGARALEVVLAELKPILPTQLAPFSSPLPLPPLPPPPPPSST